MAPCSVFNSNRLIRGWDDKRPKQERRFAFTPSELRLRFVFRRAVFQHDVLTSGAPAFIPPLVCNDCTVEPLFLFTGLCAAEGNVDIISLIAFGDSDDVFTLDWRVFG